MTIRRCFFVSAIIGAGITGVGAALMMLDHWGPCGPHSLKGIVGGFLTIDHCVLLFSTFRGLEAAAGQAGLPDILWVTVLPWLDWTLVTFFAMTLWSRIAAFRARQVAGSVRTKR